MRIESKLCHLTENKAVVHVNGWINEENLGSALGEGATVEDAEDKAISRLKKRLEIMTNDNSTRKSIYEAEGKTRMSVELPKRDDTNINNEPSDWSDELTAIDAEIERLKWTRDDEINFLEQKLGFNNRNKITRYNDIVNYLNLLKQIDRPSQTKIVNENINILIQESDSILRELKWDYKQGIQFLQKEFNVSKRMELNEEQLISFVEKLKSIRSQYLLR